MSRTARGSKPSAQPGEQRLERRLRARVDQHAVDLPAADHALVPRWWTSIDARRTEAARHRPRDVTSRASSKPDRPWMMRTYAGHSTAKKSNELYRSQPRQGPDRAVDRLRPADADRLRRRPRARARRGRQGRRADRAQGRHGRAAGRHPARRDEHVDDDQRDGGLAAGALHRHRRGERRRARASSRARPRTTSSRSTCAAAPTRSRPARRCG